MKTGINAPEGIGIVVETADIQNYDSVRTSDMVLFIRTSNEVMCFSNNHVNTLDIHTKHTHIERDTDTHTHTHTINTISRSLKTHT